MPSIQTTSRLAFGVYEADLHTGELWRSGHRVKLQSQPFRVLVALLEHPGELVTRDDLQRRLWGSGISGDFEHGLATAIKKIREALRDSADNPRFVETLSRRGYRFIAPVRSMSETAPSVDEPSGQILATVSAARTEEDVALAELAVDITPVPVTGQHHRVLDPSVLNTSWQSTATRRFKPSIGPVWRWTLMFCLLLSTALLAYWSGSRGPDRKVLRMEQLTHSGHFAVALDVTERVTSGVTDGYRLFLPVIDRGRASIATVPANGGEAVTLSIPNEVAAPTLGDISPDGSRLLMRDHLSPESEQPLWIVPTGGGSAFKVGEVLAHDGTFMPDGDGILYAAGNDLYLTYKDGGTPQLYARLPGRAFWLRWAPNGKLLRFTIIDPISHSESLWQLTANDHHPQRLLNGFADPPMECCGVWTSDGKDFIFQSQKGGNWDLWLLADDRTERPTRLTNGPLQFLTPIAPRNDNTIYFLGVDSASELQVLGANGHLTPEKNFLVGANRLEFSRDRRWVAWTDSAGRLWRATADGKEQLQLTSEDLSVFMARWSPDGSRLAFMAKAPGKAWNIYVVSAKGGNAQPLLRENRNAADPSWSADGKEVVFGRTNDIFGKESTARVLYILNLESGHTTQIPGSDNLFSPRWSPDGRYIAALTLDQREERLYNVATNKWTTLSQRSGADPVWSSDSHFLYFHELLDPAHSIDRVAVPDGALQTLIRLSDVAEGDAVDYTFSGLNASDEPVILARTTAANVYSLRLR
jgi:Tol biopolymer transport system component/DNA-binding winged helix-turn-helix (wHTH) protein